VKENLEGSQATFWTQQLCWKWNLVPLFEDKLPAKRSQPWLFKTHQKAWFISLPGHFVTQQAPGMLLNNVSYLNVNYKQGSVFVKTLN